MWPVTQSQEQYFYFNPQKLCLNCCRRITIILEKEKKQPRSSVLGTTYHRPGLADGHQTSEEVFIVQLAEHMSVIGHHNGDFFHHLASWPFHSSSCCPAPDQAVPGKIPPQLSASAHPPECAGVECQGSRRSKRGGSSCDHRLV